MIRVELKYCEYCGGLLLRLSGDAVTYCIDCARRLRELPQADPGDERRGRPRLPVARVEAAAAAPCGRTA